MRCPECGMKECCGATMSKDIERLEAELERYKLELWDLKTAISTRELMDYLSEHESDIASGINDFECLRSLFVDMFDRQPSDKLELSPQTALDNG